MQLSKSKLRRKAKYYFQVNILTDVEDISAYHPASAILLSLKLISEQSHNLYPGNVDLNTFEGLENFYIWKDKQFYQSPAYKLKKNYSLWLDFRTKFIALKSKLESSVKCHYCGLDELIVDTQNINRHNNCTLDHMIPISLGGNKYSEKNIVLSCSECNNNKGSISYEKFCGSKWLKKRIINVLTNPRIKSNVI